MTDLERAILHIKTRADAWAVKEVEKALSQEPCDEAISRQAVFDESFEVDTKEYGRIEVVGVDAIAALPPVTPKSESVTEFADRCRECGREKVLDKIRAEIKALSNSNPSYWHSGDMVDRDDVLEIIDKYKAESEEV